MRVREEETEEVENKASHNLLGCGGKFVRPLMLNYEQLLPAMTLTPESLTLRSSDLRLHE